MTTNTVRVGMRTPWGTADHAENLADGIGVVGTPGHGGVKLDAVRNRQVPAPLRRAGGWYEEDCDAYIAAHTFPDAFPRITQADALAGMRRWYPEQVDAAFPAADVVPIADVIAEATAAYLAGDPRPADEPYAADVDHLAEHGDRCGPCKGFGLVRAIGSNAGGRYKTLTGAQAALAGGRAVDCPACNGTGLELPARELVNA